MSDNSTNKRIAKNTLMLYFRMILTMLVSLYTSRVVLNVLGVSDYGTYNVVGGVVTMFGFFNGAMAAATQRFLSFDLGRKDFKQLRKTFNAAQFVHIGIAALVLVLAETIGLWFLNNYLNISEGRMEAARWVYHFSVLSFMITIVQVPYNAVIIARERMSVYAYISILEVVLKLLLVFLLSWIAFDKLKLYVVLLFAITLVIAAIYRLYTLKQFDETRFERAKDKTLYKTLISYSGWHLFGSLSGIAQNQGVSIILNMFFGPVVNAAQGIANQVMSAVNGFVGNFQMAVNPQIIKSFAEGDNNYMISLIIRGAKFSFYLLFILSLPILLEVDQILKLWLKTVPNYASTFTSLTLIVVLIDSISGSLMTAVQATGNIKVWNLVIGIFKILGLPFTYFLLRLGYPPEISLYILITISIISLFFRLYFLHKLVRFPVLNFLNEVVLKNLFIAFISVLVPYLIKLNLELSFIRLFLVVCVSIVWTSTVIYFIGLDKSEKTILVNGIKNIIVRKNHNI